MEEIINKSIEYISNLYSKADNTKLLFHNLDHALEVQNNIVEIGENSGLTAKEIFLLRLAAIFHDTGWIENKEDHESRSALIAENFLANNGIPDSDIKTISDLIKITDISLTPKTLLEKVIRDADILHVGRKGFNKKSQLLRTEKQLHLNKSFNDEQWLEKNIDFLMDDVENLSKNTSSNLETKQKGKKKDSAKSVETMFRNTIRTHVEFSSMADSKANILISVNTLLLTAIAAFLVKSLDTNPHLIIPTGVLVVVSLTTLVSAILVTRPKVSNGTFTKKDVEERRVNLMFFGNFHKMDLESFEWGMKELIKDTDYLYSKMIEDYFHLGCVLGEKYKMLRIAYNIFMYGIIISVIAFSIAVIVTSNQTNIQF